MLRPVDQHFTVINSGSRLMLLPGTPAEYDEAATAKMIFTNGQSRACIWLASWQMTLMDLRTFVRLYLPDWDFGA